MQNKRVHNLIRRVLQEKHSIDIEHPKFKGWFGKSKVTDSSNKPAKAHDEKKNQFAAVDDKNNFHHYPGIVPVARHYTVQHFNHIPTENKETKDKLKDHFYLKIEKPVFFTYFEKWGDDNMLHQMFYKGLLSEKDFDVLENKTPQQRTPDLIKIMKNKGYDGVLYANYHGELLHHKWVAFDDSSIKHNFITDDSDENNSMDDGSGNSGQSGDSGDGNA